MAPPSPWLMSPGTDVAMTSKRPSRSSGLAFSTSPATENPAHTAAKTEKIAWYDRPAARIGPRCAL